MKLFSPVRFGLVAMMVLVGLFSSGLAQTTPPTDTVPTITNGLAHENAGAGSLASRSPGNMVSAGVAQAQDAVKLGRTTSATITETEESGGIGFFAQAVDILLERLDNLLVYFVNLFLTRAGLPPFDPGDISNDNDNDNSNTNTNTNTNGNDNSNDNDNDNDNDNTNGNANDNNNANVNGNDNTTPVGGIGGSDVSSNDNTSRPPGGLRKSNR